MDTPLIVIDGSAVVVAFAISEGPVIGALGGFVLLRTDPVGVGIRATVGIGLALLFTRRIRPDDEVPVDEELDQIDLPGNPNHRSPVVD